MRKAITKERKKD